MKKGTKEFWTKTFWSYSWNASIKDTLLLLLTSGFGRRYHVQPCECWLNKYVGRDGHVRQCRKPACRVWLPALFCVLLTSIWFQATKRPCWPWFPSFLARCAFIVTLLLLCNVSSISRQCNMLQPLTAGARRTRLSPMEWWTMCRRWWPDQSGASAQARLISATYRLHCRPT